MMGTTMTLSLDARDFRSQRPKTISFRDRLTHALAPLSAKQIAQSADTTVRAAENWKSGLNSPNAEALMKLCADFDSVWAIVRQQSCRDISDAERMLDQMAELMKRRGGG